MVKRARTEETDEALTLAQRRAYMKLSLDERRRMLAAQAKRMATFYEQKSVQREREAWQGGDIVEP